MVRIRSFERGWLGRSPKGAYSPRGRSRHLLETPFSEPPSASQNLFCCKAHSRPPSQNPPFPEPSQNPFLERCVAVRPLSVQCTQLVARGGWCKEIPPKPESQGLVAAGTFFLLYSAVKQRGRERKGPQKSSRNLVKDFGAICGGPFFSWPLGLLLMYFERCCSPTPSCPLSKPLIGEGAKGQLGHGIEKKKKTSCTGANAGCAGAKEVSAGASDSWETFAPWAQTTFCTLS